MNNPAMAIPAESLTQEEFLLEELGSYAYNPVEFVYWAFPWGEPGELEDHSGPNDFQLHILCLVRDGLLDATAAIRIAVTSGHGVGKSALVAWLTLYSFTTFPDTRGIITANTENQLRTKTWAEIAKWHRLFIAKSLFEITATALFPADKSRRKEWRIDIVPWSETNTEAFAGLHNLGKRIFIAFDEASAIPDIIYEIMEGATTDVNTEIIWVCFGNPTKTSGRFRELFPGGRFSHRWKNLKVDSRSVPGTNRKQIDEWIKDYGIDSDFIRVRVLGEFPFRDGESFIPRELAEEASRRPIPEGVNPARVVLGVDVARFGKNSSVIYPRAGRDARSRPPKILRGADTVATTTAIIKLYMIYNAAAVIVDGGGVGGGVVDQLRAAGLNVFEVNFGEKPYGNTIALTGEKYMNRRTELWAAGKEFLKTGLIPQQLPGIEHTFPEELSVFSVAQQSGPNKSDATNLETKASVKSSSVKTFDVADALFLSLAYPEFDYLPIGAAGFANSGQAAEHNVYEDV